MKRFISAAEMRERLARRPGLAAANRSLANAPRSPISSKAKAEHTARLNRLRLAEAEVSLAPQARTFSRTVPMRIVNEGAVMFGGESLFDPAPRAYADSSTQAGRPGGAASRINVSSARAPGAQMIY